MRRHFHPLGHLLVRVARRESDDSLCVASNVMLGSYQPARVPVPRLGPLSDDEEYSVALLVECHRRGLVNAEDYTARGGQGGQWWQRS